MGYVPGTQEKDLSKVIMSLQQAHAKVATLEGLTSPVGVANGGTGATSASAYAVLCGGTTATGAFQSIASVGTSGQVLTSNGAGALPTFQAAPSSALTSFSASKNGTDQTGIVSATWTKVTFGTADWNDSSLYDTTNSRWTPPAGKVKLTAAVYLSVGAVDQAQSLLAIYKNGSAFRYVAIANASGTSGFVLNGSCNASASGTDYFEVYVYGGGAGDKTITGNTAYTWFAGETL